jgi:hypothetical protein
VTYSDLDLALRLDREFKAEDQRVARQEEVRGTGGGLERDGHGVID